MSTVEIIINATDVTDIVEYRSAFFESAANGIVGRCQFRIKDVPQTQDIVAGSTITVYIDSVKQWSGWALKVSRVYAFPVQNTSNPGSVTRYFLIDGSDVNLLLQKRFVFNQTEPKLIKGPFYKFTGTPTTDTTALTELHTNWLDLSGDGVDVTTLVEHVGNINVDQDANPFGAAQTWAQALQSIASLEASIFYINPDYQLVYTDVDTTTAPFALSDHPTGGKVGYRAAEVFVDGSNLINDMLVWGTAKGADHWVNNRTQDSASQTTHGRWQSGEVRFDMYRQAVVDKRANTIVYGSPNDKRGHKDDAFSVRCTVKDPGLRVAQKVDFESQVHSYSDVLPIRHLRTTFAGPTSPLYQLELSQQIDTPFDFSEQFWAPQPPIVIPKIVVPPFPQISLPGGCDCGITDTFERTESGGWGQSNSTIPWEVWWFGGQSGSIEVNGTQGVITYDADDIGLTLQLKGYPSSASIEWTPSFTNVGGPEFLLGPSIPNTDPRSTTGGYCSVFYNVFVTPHRWQFRMYGDTTTLVDGGFTITSGQTYKTTYTYDGTTVTATVSSSGSTVVTASAPLTWTVGGGFSATAEFFVIMYAGQTGVGESIAVDNLDIADVNRCTQFRFDNFDRTVADGWGVSSDGHPWSIGSRSGTVTPSVNGSQGVASFSTGGYVDMVAPTPMSTSSSFVMTTLVGGWTGGSPTNEGIEFVLDDDAGSWNYYADFYNASSGWEISVQDNSSFGFLDDPTPINGDIFIKWERNVELNASRIKFWNVGDPEPDWMVSVALDGSPPLDSLDVSVSNTTKTFDYIDFDYPGKPCFQDCPETTFDDFNRTVSGSWGTPSNGTGEDWDTAGSSAAVSVDGSAGKADCTNSASLTAIYQDLVNPLPWAGAFTMSAAWRFGSALTGVHYIQPTWSFVGNTTDESFALVLFLTADTGDQSLLDIGGTGGSADYNIPTNPSAGDTVYLKLDYIPGGLTKAKVWWGLNPEPGWQVTRTDSTTNHTETKRLIVGGSQSYTSSQFFDYINFAQCTDVPVGTGLTSTQRCTEKIGVAGATEYLYPAYGAGSTQLFINGLLQRLGIDYYETSPINGEITLAASPDSGDVLRLCADGFTTTQSAGVLTA